MQQSRRYYTHSSQISIHLPHESMITSIQVLNQLLEDLAPEMKASCLFRRLSSLTSEKIISGHLGLCKVTSLSEDMSVSHAETFSRLSNTHALLSFLRSLPPLCFPVFLSGFNQLFKTWQCRGRKLRCCGLPRDLCSLEPP